MTRLEWEKLIEVAEGVARVEITTKEQAKHIESIDTHFKELNGSVAKNTQDIALHGEKIYHYEHSGLVMRFSRKSIFIVCCCIFLVFTLLCITDAKSLINIFMLFLHGG